MDEGQSSAVFHICLHLDLMRIEVESQMVLYLARVYQLKP
jgi:hypothetical protein